MYHPTTRLLTILELLQTHPSLNSEALARRLEVEPRSVRRYIAMLQDMGMPIRAVHGPGGGYQLHPGFKLPPLMFNEEEATALVLGLLGTAWLEIGHSSVAIEGALAKVLRVLPVKARERLNAVASNLIMSPNEYGERPDATLVLDLSEATQLHRRVSIEYHSQQDLVSQRIVEPYGVVGWWGHWYLVAYCCLRKDYRIFRLDRVQKLEALEETFTRAEAFDIQAYVGENLGRISPRWRVVVEFQAPLYTVQQKIPASFGTLTETSTGVMFQTHYGDIVDLAHFLVTRALPFVVHEPPELREELARIAERITAATTPNHKEH